MKYAFCGDREIATRVLKFMTSEGYPPSVLILSSSKSVSHADDLEKISGLNTNRIFIGNEIKSIKCIELMINEDIDYLFSIHFPHIISKKVLSIPKIGSINLHPAYLPYNKGWHTPSWAIIEGSDYGATLHFMTEKLDDGNILHQKKIDILPCDTADTLYRRVLDVEFDTFKEYFSKLLSLEPSSVPQSGLGTSHNRADLNKIQEIKLMQNYTASNIINLLRGLTTNQVSESCYFVTDGKKYHIQVSITKADEINE